ncbi:hypothetical protein [Nocardioides sp. T2.26MG-1]|uniref:hypothetical protein n=1 Tax=Nocardioides sp. T2.26MG-1 TaxID=3041166 RepID=UPI0024773E65|nr:hypothetical protein [Nocardioides sp. T2.26MG-1]CAI9405003.1 hypothetical protein HIDPHFAB_04294 [Nocardioides sp. T2.26MG-1]
MGKWVDLANAEFNRQTAKEAKRARKVQAQPSPQVHIATLEARVAALEARVQWLIEVVQQQNRQP